VRTDESTRGNRLHRLAATPNTVHTGFYDRSMAPVLEVDSGDIVSMETMMLLGGDLRPELSLQEILDLRSVYRAQGFSSHSLTGPIRIDGAEPGDVLEVRILRLEPYPFGVNFFFPAHVGAGALPEDFSEGFVRGFRWTEGASQVEFRPGVTIPLCPFLGSMAVAPAAATRVSGTTPGPYGGNLDLKELTEGATLYLPVFVPGALFSAGDAHAMQGDGEVSTSALETSLKEALLQFVVRKDLKLELPFAETPSHWITMGFHEDLDEAARIALRQAIGWLVQEKGLSREEAYSLLSLAVDVRITQLVNREKGAHAMIPKSIFSG
jgi:acetamidase/formamidase